MRTDAELQAVAVNVQALTSYASEMRPHRASFSIPTFPNIGFRRLLEGFAMARTEPIPRIRYKNPSLAIVGRPPY
jgi:hypothetical protein